RVQRRALLVPVAIAPDFRPRALLAHEWIIRWNRSIRVKTNQLPLVLVQVLGSGPLVVLAERDEQIAISVEHEPGAKVRSGRQFGLLSKNDFESFQSLAILRQTP